MAVIITAFLGLVGVLAGLLLQRRKLTAEALGAESGTAASLFAEVNRLRGELLVARAEAVRLQSQNDELTARVTRLEAALPALSLAAHLQSLAPDTMLVLDECGPLVIVSTEEDGRFRWVSRDFAAALGRTRDEILVTGWRNLVHPDDLKRTLSAEVSMWGEPTRIVNRYLHANGSSVWLRWCATRYLHGVSLAHAEVLPAPVSEA